MTKTLADKNIKSVRQHRGWNQDKLARNMGISNTVLSEIETGVTDLNSSRLPMYYFQRLKFKIVNKLTIFNLKAITVFLIRVRPRTMQNDHNCSGYLNVNLRVQQY